MKKVDSNNLVFVNELGPNYKGDNIYEFIFSDKPSDIWGESWESRPANGNPNPPFIENITKVGVLKSESIGFSVVQKSDWFSMIDALDSVIALAWENESDFVDFGTKKRLVFSFGESEESVKNKLYERDLVLEFENKVVYEN